MEENKIQPSDIAKIEQYFEKAIQLVRYNKTKDDIIEKTGKDIQRYRDGFALSAFKPLAVSVITYRENCKKELADLAKYEYTADALKKNFNYLIDDLQDVLLDNGADFSDNGFTYCGRDIMQPIDFGTVKKEEPACESQEQCEDACECESAESCECADEQTENAEEQVAEINIEELLEKYQTQLLEALADNAKLESYVKNSVDKAREIDAENKRILIYPVFYQLGLIKETLDSGIASFPKSEETFKQEYAEILTKLDEKLLFVLELLGVNVEAEHAESDKIVAGFHKLIKTVPTEIEEDDRKIASILSDAYTFDGKVIYPQKVEVFKYIKK